MADQVTAIVKSLSEFAERLMKKLTLDITANLIETTPVDTGWARVNWVPQIGSPLTTPVGVRPDGVNGEQINPGPQSQGIANVGSYKLIQGPIYISNNVPYITKLNEGSSRQAPAAFVQAAIEKGIAQNAEKV